MKKFNVLIISFLTVFTFGINTFVEAQFSISGELRPRTEYRHGFKNLVSEDAKAAFQISQRTRVNAAYTFKNLEFGISVQDIRLWGETPQLTATSNRFMLHQAWAEIGLSQNLALKLGRHELVYDDARILGNVDWAQQGRSHDLALLKYENKFKLHVGIAFNQQFDQLLSTKYDLTTNYKSLQFLWYNKQIKNLSVSVLVLNNGMEYKYVKDSVDMFKTVFSQTMGTHLNYKTEKLTVYGNVYYTIGKDANDRNLNAYNFMVAGDYKFSKNWGIGLGVETLSGTSQKEKKENPNYTNKSFNPFYGTNHKFNGFMDYFYVSNHLNSVGLNDLFMITNFKKNKTSVSLTAHLFSAAADVIKPNQAETILLGKNLGTELDLIYSYKINEIANVSVGYSQMFGSETLQALKGGDYKQTNNWVWAMISFKPTFFKQ